MTLIKSLAARRFSTRVALPNTTRAQVDFGLVCQNIEVVVEAGGKCFVLPNSAARPGQAVATSPMADDSMIKKIFNAAGYTGLSVFTTSDMSAIYVNIEAWS